MQMTIHSKKYGDKIIEFDDEDYDLIKRFKWTIRKNHDRKTFYARVFISLHTLILGQKTGLFIDHIDGNGLNNKRNNLRHCTVSQNNCNRKHQKNNKLGIKGVYRYKNGYRASIGFNNKKMRSKKFKSPEEAALAYNDMAIKLHGDFAVLHNVVLKQRLFDFANSTVFPTASPQALPSPADLQSP